MAGFMFLCRPKLNRRQLIFLEKARLSAVFEKILNVKENVFK